MKYCSVVTLMRKLDEFKENLKGIDIAKADKKRNGRYTIALEQLDAVLDSRMDMEEISHPDNTLRNIMMLAHLDKTDATTRKFTKRVSSDGVFYRCDNCGFEPEMGSTTDDLVSMHYCPKCGREFE